MVEPEKKYHIVSLPLEVFENQEQAKVNLTPEVVIIKELKYDDLGISCWVEGQKYPMKGYPLPHSVDAAMVVKRALIDGLRIFSSLSGLVYCLFHWKKILANFVDFSNIVLVRFYLKPEKYCRSGREVYRVGMELAGNSEVYRRLVKCIVMIWEYDDAYRYRFQDAFGAGENVREGLETLLDRETSEGNEMKAKWRMVLKAFSWLMFIPKFSRLVKKIDELTNWNELKLDIADKYHAFAKPNYDFGNFSFEERQVQRNNF